ncbi:MAG: zeta toxin, partial [Gammaproteobacteria bacterium]
IPEETIRRRYISGIKNFFNLYQPLLDQWRFYDNSYANSLSPIAYGIKDQKIIKNKVIWKHLLEHYCE